MRSPSSLQSCHNKYDVRCSLGKSGVRQGERTISPSGALTIHAEMRCLAALLE